MGGMRTVVNKGETVFVKPNFMSFPWAKYNKCFHVGECTKPEIIIAVAEECLKAGAAEVIIGEGSHLPKFEWQHAVTLDGRLVNVDGLGNRVAAMIFGPRKVVLIAGVNKIVKDVDEAMERIHQVAAPMNAKRHYLKHHFDELGDLPCVKTGRCVDCTHDWKICCFTVVVEGTQLRDKGRINMILVGEELGI